MKAAERLSGAVKFKTVSYSDYEKMDFAEFSAFLSYIEKSYPEVFSRLEVKRVGEYNLILRFPSGSSSKKPYLFIAHYDVVPAIEEEGWPHPPFSGAIEEGKIWGRGSFDDKASMIGLLEALELLLGENFIPCRDLYFAFGHDEEVGGVRGAVEIAKYFKEKKLSFEAVLDEGGAVSSGSALGIEGDVAVVGLAEKGSSTLRFTFSGDEGHSSTPPKHTSIGKMAAFIKDVEDHPRQARLIPSVEAMLRGIAPYKNGFESRVLSDPDKYFFILKRILSKNKQTAAMLRTTVAFTMTEAGQAQNVLPRTASCVANVRVLPGDSFEEIMAWFYSFKHDFKIDVLLKEEGTTDSSVKSRFYTQLEACIHRHFPEALPTPYLVTGGTDSRHYKDIVDNSYRFLPCRVTEEELSRMHGRGEYISIENLNKMIEFYADLLRREGQNV
ncbi:MAG: M20/M25/M40 family metallo-hydrolase [Tissierellia bacterium]|nr:M20/M25/M40 family metallo-hydrolase [Tissierellia bacterium]